MSLTQPASLQLVKPGSQAAPHWPPAHVRKPWLTIGQAWAQPPQFSGSVATFVQVTSQSSPPTPQTSLHTPASQAASPPTGSLHTALHAPQFVVSFAASTSQPFTTFSSQSRDPSVQVLVHAPLTQVVPGHEVPHPPQWRELVRVSTH